MPSDEQHIDSERRRPQPGTVLLCDVVTGHVGQIMADVGSKLAMVFLGTAKEDDEVDPSRMLETLGWTRSVVYEVAVQLSRDGIRETQGLNFIDASPMKAAFGAVRFAKRMAAQAAEGMELEAMTLRSVQLGAINNDGMPKGKRGKDVLGWSRQMMTFDEFEEKLRERADEG